MSATMAKFSSAEMLNANERETGKCWGRPIQPDLELVHHFFR
jgi:hypothetical protein